MGEGDGSGALVGIAVGMFVMATIFESITKGVGVGGSGKGVGLAGISVEDDTIRFNADNVETVLLVCNLYIVRLPTHTSP